MLQVFHEIGNNLDKGFETDIIYLDLSKAFDSVCHQKRLSKLLYFGIDGPLHKWLESFLSARKQRVVINGSYSTVPIQRFLTISTKAWKLTLFTLIFQKLLILFATKNVFQSYSVLRLMALT